MFCLTSLKQWELQEPSLNLKCDPVLAIELRANYEAVEPGYHMSKMHWNTVNFNSDVNDEMMCKLIIDSYFEINKNNII